MKQYTKQANSMFYTSILYICSFFLFLEWIFPLEDVTDTENITVFIIYAAFCFIISLLRLKWWLAFSFKGIALIIVIHSLYYDISLLNLTWRSEERRVGKECRFEWERCVEREREECIT